ncbi:hypothetical protein FOC1_g10012751 [Fusarium oxysporum f. sp. cubense race 1]|uniref:Extracellular membrane protein CFEM domain-containing protein n=1 Tax=Fusarium oxysporum f. sp. cubense (strain race 1) TaxID=1229664 RepID=N4TGL2_FUSC1|nr:hypothetical protein FOC1_g10012751 [Fusarium oxysporum f. sp. cubense race 1]
MASGPFSFVPAWLIFCVTVVLATNISNEFSSFIPSCAGECFASFLNVNYAPGVCTGKPLLDCLCSRRGASGFTLGEGAMQCISAERSIGYCSIVEASDRVIENAYDICNGRPGAVHPTYLTITATLVLAPSGGVVTFPSVTTKTTSRPDTSSTIRTLPTTLVIDTSSPPVIPRPSTKPISSTTRSTAREQSTTDSSDDSDIISITEPPFTKPTTFETSTYTSTSSSESETTTDVQGGAGGAGGASKDEDSDDSDKLSTEQVAGISVGVLAAVGVAVGAIVLARYYRRRKYPQIKTGFLPMRDTWGYKPDRSDNGGHNSWMVHQLRPDLDPTNHPPPPPTSNRRKRSGTRSLAPPAEIIPGGAPSRPGGPRPQYPSPFFSSQSHPRRSASNRRSMTRPLTRPREDSSSSSATIITTSTESSSSIPSVAPEQQVSLSPVVESPQSVRARQQQPQIPPRDPRRASQMGNPGVSVNPRAAPPTRQVVYSPPGQPSPTLGLMQPPSAYYAALQSKAQLNAQPQQKPQSAVQSMQPADNTGTQAASSTMRIVEPSPEPDETTEPANVKEDQIRASPFYFDPPYPQPLHSRQTPQHRRSASGPQPQQYQPYQRPPSFQPSPRQQQAAWQPVQRLHSHNHQQQRHNHQQQQQNPWQPTQRIPPTYPPFQQQQPLQCTLLSSLGQASNITLVVQEVTSHFNPILPHSRLKYTLLNIRVTPPPQSMNPSLVHSDSQDSLLAKRVGLDRAAGMTIGTDKTGASKWNRDIQNKTPPNLPLSPHWQPTLTPTRRGDDLVLNVQ